MTTHRVLVMGGAGFLGSHLCDRLVADGHHVVAVDDFSTGSPENVTHLAKNPLFTLHEHDVIQPIADAVTASRGGGRVDRIYNLACPASPVHYQADPVRTTVTNVIGTLNALKLAEKHRARLLQASTSEVYGDPKVHPQPEGYHGNVNPIGIRACYDEGKRCAESLAMDFFRRRSADVRIARIFNTYGPRMAPDDGRVVSNFILQALTDEDITIYGEGSQTRSFCYVDDLIEGLVRLMEHPSEIGPINLGNPREFTVLELAREVIALTGSQSAVVHLPLPEDDPKLRRPDIARARKVLGFEPRITLRDGLSRTIHSFRVTETTRRSFGGRARIPSPPRSQVRAATGSRTP